MRGQHAPAGLGLTAVWAQRVRREPQRTGGHVQARAISQRVDFNLLTEPAEVLPYPPRITLGDYELGDAQAREIARHLLEAVEFVERLRWV